MCAWDVDLDVLHIVETDPTAPGGGNALLRSWIQVVGSGARLRRGQGDEAGRNRGKGGVSKANASFSSLVVSMALVGKELGELWLGGCIGL